MGSQAAQTPDPPSTPHASPTPHDVATQQHLPLVETTPVPSQTAAPQPSKPREDPSDALAAEKARVQSLISRIVSNAHASTAPPQPAKDAPARQSSSGKHASFEWTETTTAASLVYRVPADTRTAHVSVNFASDQLDLSVTPPDAHLAFKLSRALRGRITIDSCWWALEDRSDGSRVLLVELEKTVPSTWRGVFEGDDQGAVETPNFPNETAAAEKLDASTTDASPTEGNTDDPSDEAPANESQSIGDAVEEFVDTVIEAASVPGASEKNDSIARSEDGSPVTEVEDVPEDDPSDTAPAPGAHGRRVDPPMSNVTAASSSVPTDATDAQDRKVLTRQDLPKLIAQHRAAVAARGPGWAEAAVQLGTLYHFAIGVEHDDTEAARLYRLGLENGATDASAAFQLGLIYNQGDGANLRPDAEQAVKWWTVSAELGNAVAMFNLGVLRMNGSGCDMDPVAAMTWFQKARQLNPKLEIPQMTPAQLEQRVAMARRVRKERRWAAMSEEERERRRLEAFSNLKLAMTATAGVAAFAVGAVIVRNWWRNRL